MKKEIKVFAPASIGNLGIGFDIMGMALEQPGDEVVVKDGTKKGLIIAEITGDDGRLPVEVENNTASNAALELLKFLGKEDLPIEMEIHKKMPIGSGLGSSGASAVAGVFAMNEFLGSPLSKKQLLPFAMKAEEKSNGSRCGDNVAPSLFGGIVLLRSNVTMELIQLPCPENLVAAMLTPSLNILTRDSRNKLDSTVPLSKMIQQTANIGCFVSSLYTEDFQMMQKALDDVIIEPQRAQYIPHFYEIKTLAQKAGTLGFSISGSGPSMFALFNNKDLATGYLAKANVFLKEQGIESNAFISKINMEGAKRIH